MSRAAAIAFVSVALMLTACNVASAAFTEVSLPIPGMDWSTVAWGDYDNDGDLDIAVTGHLFISRHIRLLSIYRNDGAGIFVEAASLPTSDYSRAVCWADVDNDGDLDLAAVASNRSRIYLNDRGSFRDVEGEIVPLSGKACWGDYDGDGGQDLAVAGASGGAAIVKVYRNESGVLTDAKAGIPDAKYTGCLAWSDYDMDGDLDIVTSGRTTNMPDSIFTKLYRNDSGRLVDAKIRFPGGEWNAAAWGDYDDDGDPDLAVVGEDTYFKPATIIMRNDNGRLIPVVTKVQGGHASALAWGDYDNDGRLDLVVTGRGDTSTKLYRNLGDDVFEPMGDVFADVMYGSVAWGDYDSDGDLDLLLSGGDGIDYRVTKLYRNDGEKRESRPIPPDRLVARVTGLDVTFTWSPGADVAALNTGLTYNLRVGSKPGKDDVVCCMADTSTGSRRIPAFGNTEGHLTRTLRGLPPGSYYWSVQALDTNLLGSAWAPEQKVTVRGVKIEGYVRDKAGRRIRGAVVSARGSGSGSTDAVGYYKLGVPEGWSGEVIPSKSGYRFSPPAAAYSNLKANPPNRDFTAGAQFTDSGIKLTGVCMSSAAWGDYDNDGRVDLASIGSEDDWDRHGTGTTTIYHNDRGSFRQLDGALPDLTFGDVAWGDYDRDGDLDLIASGHEYGGGSYYLCKVFRNDRGDFKDANLGLPAIGAGGVAWGDFDNDGDLDLAICGEDLAAQSELTAIYRNDAGAFAKVDAGLLGTECGSVAWGDYDVDGDLDLLITGHSKDPFFVTRIYRNDNGSFKDIKGDFATGYYGCGVWGDYDSDGDLDFAVCGQNDGNKGPLFATLIYRNDGPSFTKLDYHFPGVCGQLAWGDYDNDGDLDLALTGSGYSKVFRNDRKTFTDIEAVLPGLCRSSVDWADYDSDGDLDLLLSGDASSKRITRIYRNNSTKRNTAPTPPARLAQSVVKRSVLLSWQPGTDKQTASKGLQYNIRIGTRPGSGDIASGTNAPGFARPGCSRRISGLSEGRYYWSVQSVDTAFARSEWAKEQAFTIGHAK